MSGRGGGGRGAFLRSLQDSTTDESSKETDSQTRPSFPDSGLGRCKTVGRGRFLLEKTDNSESNTPSHDGSSSLATSGVGASMLPRSGRGKLLQLLSNEKDEKPKIQSSIVSYDETVDSTAEQFEEMMAEPVETELQPVIRRGTKGRPVNLAANYIRLNTDPDKGVFEYEVRFSPAVHSLQLRYKLLNQHRDTIGNTRTFDGSVLYLPIMLPDARTILISNNDNDETRVTLTIIFKKKKQLKDCVHLYNVLFERIMKILKLVRFGRKNFDPTVPKLIPQHKLEIWPGYVTAVDEYEDGVMLCLDVSHRLLNKSTVLETLTEIYKSDKTNFQQKTMEALLGQVVLTRYNNRTYRIDAILSKNVMIRGIDTYHDTKKKDNSVGAFIASLNGTYTEWYSRAVIQSQKEELVNGLAQALIAALHAYKQRNDVLPDKIIIYRDGVGDGQLKMVSDYELPQLVQACTLQNPDYKPLFTFLIVQKRINTRLFLAKANGFDNPAPGCIIDHSITRRYLYDFFLVPQNVRQGTVTPTHFIVVHDDSNYAPDVLQRLTYKMCFLYYNWPGTVRVDCCQYAHKLAFLVGQSVKKPPSEQLADKLYYL